MKATKMAQGMDKPSYIVTSDEILALGVTKIPMLIEGLLPLKGLCALTGSSDVSKSFLALFLAIFICGTESEVLGRKINRRHGSVIVVCTEDSPEDMCVRLTRLLEKFKIEGVNLRFIFESDNTLTKLRRELSRLPADLVILDTFGDLYSKNLNDSIGIRQFFKPYKKIATDFDCLLLFIHHIGKGKENNTSPSKNDVLGSQGIEAVCRTVFNLRKRSDGKRILTVVKGNHIPDESKDRGIVLSFDIKNGFMTTGETANYSEGLAAPSNNEALIKEILILYPELKSYQKVSEALKRKGYKKVDKNRVGKIWKVHGPSDTAPTENDGRINGEEDNG